MKVALFMAMSVNGLIARVNGEEDFLSHENWESFCALANEYKNFIVGRKTYEAVQGWEDGYTFDDLDVDKVVISTNSSYNLGNPYVLATSPREALNTLKEKGFERALVTGGSTINTAFAKENLLDEIILNVEPTIIGNGIPLFSPTDFAFSLELVSTERSDSGIVTLRYKVKNR